MNDSLPPRGRAVSLRAACLHAGALLTASLTLMAVACACLPALAAAQLRRPTATRRTPRRQSARFAFTRRRTLIVTPSDDQSLSVSHRTRRPQLARRCADAQVRIGRATRLQTQRATVCLLNIQRMRRGLPPLALNGRLDHSAQSWTNTMVRDHSFSHGSDFASRISAVGFDWSQIGENIAAGYRTPTTVVKAWMGSTGHCENILNPDFREVGAGFDLGAALGGSERGTWTTDFGLLMDQHASSDRWGPAEHCPY